MALSWQQTSLESLEVGAVPLVQRFLLRLRLTELFEQHLPTLPGRQPALSTARALSVLLTNLLLARQPLHAILAWASRRVPEHLGLEPQQVALLFPNPGSGRRETGAESSKFRIGDHPTETRDISQHVICKTAFVCDGCSFNRATAFAVGTIRSSTLRRLASC